MDDGQVMRALAIDESYRVERVLAEGPTGRTELVAPEGEDDSLLVRKRIPIALSNARTWAAVVGVDDPLVPHVESIYRMPDELVVVYDYVEGDPLNVVVAREGELDVERATSIARDVCHAAGVLHGVGVVHRDITPGNVICASDGAHLVDLGIARVGDAERSHDTTTLGTWGFIAPEQLGYAQTDARSDVFSIGRLLGYMLTGFEPDKAGYEILMADEDRVPAPMRAVIGRACALEPSARYQSADALAQALEAAARGEVASGAQPGDARSGDALAPEAAAEDRSGGARPDGGGPVREAWPAGGADRATMGDRGTETARAWPAAETDDDEWPSLFPAADEVRPDGRGADADKGSEARSTRAWVVGPPITFDLSEPEAEPRVGAGQQADPQGWEQPQERAWAGAGQQADPQGWEQPQERASYPQGAGLSEPYPAPSSVGIEQSSLQAYLRSWLDLPVSSKVMEVTTWASAFLAITVFANNSAGNRQGAQLVGWIAMDAWAIVWTAYAVFQSHRRTMEERRYRWSRIPLGLLRWFGILFVGLFVVAAVRTIFFPDPKN